MVGDRPCLMICMLFKIVVLDILFRCLLENLLLVVDGSSQSRFALGISYMQMVIWLKYIKGALGEFLLYEHNNHAYVVGYSYANLGSLPLIGDTILDIMSLLVAN